MVVLFPSGVFSAKGGKAAVRLQGATRVVCRNMGGGSRGLRARANGEGAFQFQGARWVAFWDWRGRSGVPRVRAPMKRVRMIESFIFFKGKKALGNSGWVVREGE